MVNVCLLKSGVSIVEFGEVADRENVIEAGPWYFDNKPVVVKPWGPKVCLEREGLANIPIWIKLPGLKLHCLPLVAVIMSVNNGLPIKLAILLRIWADHND